MSRYAYIILVISKEAVGWLKTCLAGQVMLWVSFTHCRWFVVFCKLPSHLTTSNGSWRQGIKGKCPAQFISHCYGISFIEYVFESHYLSHHYDQISPYCVILGPRTLMIKYAKTNDDNNYDNNNNDNNLPVVSPRKGPIMLSFDVTFVESKSNSRVSGDLRRYVPHVKSCDAIYSRSTVISVLLKAVMNKLVHICPSLFKIV